MHQSPTRMDVKKLPNYGDTQGYGMSGPWAKLINTELLIVQAVRQLGILKMSANIFCPNPTDYGKDQNIWSDIQGKWIVVDIIDIEVLMKTSLWATWDKNDCIFLPKSTFPKGNLCPKIECWSQLIQLAPIVAGGRANRQLQTWF